MLTERVKDLLKNNWGEKADALECYAEVKFIDTLSDWQCYIYAMNEDEIEIQCFVYTPSWGGQLMRWTLPQVLSVYNEDGEHPVLDYEYRRVKVTELLRRLGNET